MSPDDEELAPAHVGLPPVPEHTCEASCDHRGAAKDFTYDRPPVAPACSRCLAVAWRGYNVGLRRYEFCCMNTECKMRWYMKGGRMGPI